MKFYKVKDEVILENVCFSYDKNFVFKDFSLRIKKGEKILIKGPNGSGKTTLANIMSGLLKVQSRNVILPPRISYLTLPFEFPLLKIKELPIKEKLLKDFGLMEFVDKYPHELSIGNMQKLAIALIFSKEADLYILDEPLANIDKESTIVLMKHILDLSRDKTLVVIMHKGDEWHQFFDRILDLKENKKD
ncbi:MAG: ABC transporter ATP-binding protein [candidate division WOR-3 bacterium]